MQQVQRKPYERESAEEECACRHESGHTANSRMTVIPMRMESYT